MFCVSTLSRHMISNFEIIPIDLIECYKGLHYELSPPYVLDIMLGRFRKNISSWSLTTKVYVIFHRCMQDPQLAKKMAIELVKKDNLLYSFQKKASDVTYETSMYSELCLLYSNYIKYMAHYKAKHDLLSMRMTDVLQKAKMLSVQDIL